MSKKLKKKNASIFVGANIKALVHDVHDCTGITSIMPHLDSLGKENLFPGLCSDVFFYTRYIERKA